MLLLAVPANTHGQELDEVIAWYLAVSDRVATERGPTPH